MEIIIQDTYSLYNKVISLPDEQRENYFENTLMEPFHKLFNTMRMPIKPESIGGLQLTGQDYKAKKMLDTLKSADAWNIARKALESAAARFEAAAVPMPEKVVLGIFLGNPEFLRSDAGITGFGGFPGYIQIVIAPDEHNLKLMPSIIAHEFHHNVLFSNAKWNFMNVSVAKYLAVEGLAESFAESIYGYEYLGPWVKNLEGEDLSKASEVIGKALNVIGFNEARKYIFGDQLVNTEGADSTGLPPTAGYAVGYHAVQAFLKNTGVSIEEATLLDGEIIMERSGYFK